MKKILLIINPTAGKSNEKAHVYKIADWFRHKGYFVSVYKTTKRGDAKEFVEQYAPSHDIVICCGGDGTLNEVITGNMHLGQKKPIGYLPAGTTNDMARTLRIPTNIKKAARTITTGEPVPQDVGAFNDTKYFTYIASFGAFTRVSYATPQWLKNRLGHFAYVLDSFRRVGDIKPFHLHAAFHGTEEDGEYIFGSISNSCSIGGVLKLDPSEVGLNDGKFEVLLIRSAPNLLEFQKILYDLKHHNFDNPYIEFFKIDRITFRFEQQMDWTLDGEFEEGACEVEIRNLQSAVSLIRKET